MGRTDSSHLGLVGANDEPGLDAAFYAEHAAALRRHLRCSCGDFDVAEDLLQEVFAIAIRRLPQFERRSSVSTWLHGIAINVARRDREQRQRRSRLLAELERRVDPSPAGSVEDAHLAAQRFGVLAIVLDELPRHLREAFVLRDLLRMPIGEAAVQLDVSCGNLRVRAARARARVQARLIELGHLAADRPPASGGAAGRLDAGAGDQPRCSRTQRSTSVNSGTSGACSR